VRQIRTLILMKSKSFAKNTRVALSMLACKSLASLASSLISVLSPPFSLKNTEYEPETTIK
jgi:hypothetical protein